MGDKIQLGTLDHGNGFSVILELNPKTGPQFNTSVSDTFKSKEEANDFIKEFAIGLNKVLNELAAEERRKMGRELIEVMDKK